MTLLYSIVRWFFVSLVFVVFSAMAAGVLLTVRVLWRASAVDDAQRYPKSPDSDPPS